MKSIAVWGNDSGPNPYKVLIILEELNLPYEFKELDFPSMKQQPYVDINPNGRVPAIEDPNTGITLWESGAIVEYLVEQYDAQHRISYDGLKEGYLIRQWIAYQISGQGPYYGQLVWFHRFHTERVQSVVDRFLKEVERVRAVLDSHLSRSNAGWLVSDKCTVADLSWYMWEQIATFITGTMGISWEGKYPHYEDWYKRLAERPSCRKAIKLRTNGLRRSGLVPDAPSP